MDNLYIYIYTYIYMCYVGQLVGTDVIDCFVGGVSA